MPSNQRETQTESKPVQFEHASVLIAVGPRASIVLERGWRRFPQKLLTRDAGSGRMHAARSVSKMGRGA